MIIYDISVQVTPQTVTWENSERPYGHAWAARIGDDGSPCNLSVLDLGAHLGTHLDSPLHFIEGGHEVHELDLNMLVGPAQIVEIVGRPEITAEDCAAAGIPEGTVRVLFKTDNTARGLLADHTFHPDYVGIAPSAAAWLVERGVKLVGVDYISVGPYGERNVETHRTLLGAGVIVVEGLLLTEIAPGGYTFAALPPKFTLLEGSPCRAILMKD